MDILVAGSSGLIGSAFCKVLEKKRHGISRLSRDDRHRPTWDPVAGTLDWGTSGPFDAVIHLAGENIADGRWTRARKQRIRDSRVQGTRLLAESLAALPSRPRILISASAVGFYGSRADHWLDEHSRAGEGFLAELCQAWEQATQPAIEAGIRVIHLRLGVVLSKDGGLLERLVPIFRRGLGGVMGSGQQYLSWVTLSDVVRAIEFILKHDDLKGPVNLCTPNPVTNRELTKTLGRVLHRPTILPMPALAIKTLLGEMGRELILASQRVKPRVLLDAGFEFEHAEIEGTLKAAINSIVLA